MLFRSKHFSKPPPCPRSIFCKRGQKEDYFSGALPFLAGFFFSVFAVFAGFVVFFVGVVLVFEGVVFVFEGVVLVFAGVVFLGVVFVFGLVVLPGVLPGSFFIGFGSGLIVFLGSGSLLVRGM